MTAHFDVVVLGAGPGGYTAAIRASQLGLKAAVIEKQYWGGVCLNVGCIPTKSLLRNAELARLFTHERDLFGISVEGEVKLDYGKAHSRSRDVANKSAAGVHYLMKKNKIQEFDGWGTFTDAKTIQVTKNDGSTETVTGDNIIINTGSVVRMLPGMQPSANVQSYEELILSDTLPKKIIVGGAGAIGTEFAYVLNSYGVDVTIVEYLDRLLPVEDADLGKELLKAYKKLGIKVMTGTAVKNVEDTGAGVRITVEPAAGGDQQVLEADKMLSAFGFAPRVEGFGLENTGVALTDRGAIAIDDFMRTNVDGVYAIGDVTAKLMLAHTAEAQGIVAAETIGGAETMPLNYDMIPHATYCQPQVAAFGYTEQKAKELGYDVKVAKFPFSANGKARGMGETVGFVKIIADATYGEILGAHMIGPEVTELLPELVLAQTWDLTAEEIGRTVHAHPTLSETLKEAAHGIAGHMINL